MARHILKHPALYLITGAILALVILFRKPRRLVMNPPV